MPDYRAPAIAEPEEGTRTLIIPTPTGHPVMTGQGDTNWLCGECDLVLLFNVDEHHLHNVVIKCPQCGSFCDIS